MKIKLDYYDTLKDIRNVLKNYLPRFPEDGCEHSSNIIYRICFKKYKIDEVAGYYLPSEKKHSWNYDPINKLYIDVSINQFSDKFPNILIASKEDCIRILKEDGEVYDEHFETIGKSGSFNRIAERIIEEFVKLYPDKKEQIIMG